MIYLLIALAAAARLVPHFPNAAPITAIAIFAASYLPKRQAVALPLLARFVSDALIGFFSWPLMLAVYAAHLFGVVLGLWIRNSKPGRARWIKITSVGFLSALVFFLTTNFALLYSNYPHTWAGIIASYVNGLPFLRGTLISDVGYTVALFGIYALASQLALSRRLPQSIEQQSLAGSNVLVFNKDAQR